MLACVEMCCCWPVWDDGMTAQACQHWCNIVVVAGPIARNWHIVKAKVLQHVITKCMTHSSVPVSSVSINTVAAREWIQASAAESTRFII